VSPGRYALILTHNRLELLTRCISAIAPQVDLIVVIDNASDPPVKNLGRDLRYIIVRDGEQPPNLSRLWNIGIKVISNYATTDSFDIAFLCDDAVVHDTWFQDVSTCMREHGAMAGSTHSAMGVQFPIMKTHPDSDIWNRMCPWAFIMRGEARILADEDLRWWWGDTHMDFTARRHGGMVIAPGPVVANEKLGEFTNIHAHLAEQAGRDGETFAAKWGRPW